MPDPIADPTAEDTVHVGIPLVTTRVGLAKSNKDRQSEAYQRRMDREKQELATVLGTEAGEAFIMRVLDRCGIYADDLLTKAQQGKRMVGVGIIKDLHGLGPEIYPGLLVNHARRQQRIKDADNAIHASDA